VSRRGGARDAAPGDARSYLGKAVQFMEVAETSLAAELFSPAVGNAVHAGIAAADAISAAVLHQVWKGSHSGAVDHLRRAGIEGRGASIHLNRLLNLKQRAEYDPQQATAREAEDAVKAAQRLLSHAAAVFDRL
jgi:hypothetical protein